MSTRYPVESIFPALRSALDKGGTVILSAPPGSGKTTMVPPALLAEPWLRGQKIIILEPRRLAARMAAERMADMLGEAAGKTIGYQMRFESKISAETRIEVVTEGILIRRLQDDPELQGTGLVIFDEFHERNLHSDLALALCLDIRQSLRQELRLLIMSATLDTEALQTFLKNAPVIAAAGKTFPVSIEYMPAAGQEWFRDPPSGEIVQHSVAAVRRALAEQQGDILVFLPGAGEIHSAAEKLAACGEDADIEIDPLFGDLPKTAQLKALLPSPQGRRKIVLATNIAETSLTIEGIMTVIDSGWRRISRFSPGTGLNHFATVRISKAAALQRANRAGRLAPGHCYRLWSKGFEQSMIPFAVPEILEADLASLALELACWGVNDFRQLNWLTPPPEAAYEQAKNLLRTLGALDHQGSITALGRRMAGTPVHPRLAHMILEAQKPGLSGLACDLAAILSERDILKRNGGSHPADIGDRLDILDQYRRHGRHAAEKLGADPGACARVEKNSRQLKKLFRAGPDTFRPATAGLLLACAFPDRVGQRRLAPLETYLLANGRGARLPEHDRLKKQRYLAVAQLDAGKTDGRIFLAAAIEEKTIRRHFTSRITSVDHIAWDEKLQAVAAERREMFQALTLSASPLKDPDPEAVARAMIEGIQQMGLDSLPWDKKAVSLRERLHFLRRQQPEAGWPDLSDHHLLTTLDAWLAPYLPGINRRAQLKALDLEKILRQMLTWEQQTVLDHEAPESIQVPSGSRIKLSYPANETPVLAVRIQEVFGLTETPRLLGGRLPVIIHLLSPAHRPMQVTRDLGSFWKEIYPAVKKELQGRYPRHHWPADPLTACPTAHAKKRQR